MFNAERQHPVAAVTKVLEIIKGNFISLLVLLFVTSGGESMVSLFGILSVMLFLLVGGILSWLRFTYSIVDGELRIEQGIFVRKNIYLSKERIQVIDIKAGVLQRLFGLVEVEVKTAGSSSKEAKISAISREKAEQLKSILRVDQSDKTEVREEEETFEIFELSPKDLIITSCTSGSFGIALSIVGTVFSQLDQVLSEEQMLYYLETIIPASVSANMVVYGILFVVIISWLLSFLGTLIKYYGFTLTVQQKELIIRQGLFEQRQLTIPFNRIQAIQVKEGIMRQPFGFASVILESAGYGEQEGNSTTLYPLIKKKNLAEFLEKVIPEYSKESLQAKPPAKALRRYLFRMVLGSLAIIIPSWFFIPYGEYSLVLLLPALLLGFAQYRAAAIGSDEDTLTIRSRVLSKTTAMIQKKRIQRVSLNQNPFQKRLGLLSYMVTVASGSHGRSFTIRELDRSVARTYFQWVSPVPKSDDLLSEAE